MKVLVTGGAGFIGSNIVCALVERGDQVRVLDNLCEGKRENLQDVINDIEFLEDDLRDVDAVRKAVEGVEVVLNQAALRSVPKSIDDPVSYLDVNVVGMHHLLEAARQAGVRRVVTASSSSVYGETDVLPETEDLLPAPISPYAASKLVNEVHCRVYAEAFGLETVCLRYFNVFGPRQDPGSEYAVVIPKFILCILAGESPPVHGDGLQSRDFTYIDNVVEANLLAAEAPDVGPGEPINVACGETYTVLDIVTHVNRILGTDVQPLHEPTRQGDVRHTQADITRAQQLLKFSPSIGFEEGMRRTIEWFRNRPA